MRVIAPGALALVQDLGRPGLASLGVGASGPMDRAAHRLANRLVGNPDDAAALEILLGGAEFEALAPLWVAVTGAAGELSIPPRTAVRLEPGEHLHLGQADAGVRYSVAVRGGLQVPAVLGSRATDTLARLGPAPVRAGDVLPIGTEPGIPIPVVDFVAVADPATGTATLRVHRGPRDDWFASAAWPTLLRGPWSVSARSDRTGIRLDGAALERRRSAGSPLEELPSEGMVPGGIQVSPDGSPTILGADAPVTGGYPVIGVVADESLDAAGQLRPGQRVAFISARAPR